MKYEDITFEMLGTRRQRPMFVSEFIRFRKNLDMTTYPMDPKKYTEYFLKEIDNWINSHTRVKYIGLDSFERRDAILGTTQQLDELHALHSDAITVYKGEYKYHRRLTDFEVKQISHWSEIQAGDVFVASYPSCITTGYHDEFDKLLEHCDSLGVPVHIDGAWFGQCRNFEFDVTHPAIHSVSVSLSKALGMGSQRIGIRYTRQRVHGPIAIMNDFDYANVSDMWLGVEAMKYFGVDYWWGNYEEYYTRVCKDFKLEETDSIHVGWIYEDGEKHQFGIRTPLRFLIDGKFDERGTDRGLNAIEKAEPSKLAEGWIRKEEIDLVGKYMKGTGSILEVGCAVGKLYTHLYQYNQDWHYAVVDPFEDEQVRLQKDWNIGYFDKDNLGELVTRDEFEKNCPYAQVNQCYFEEYETDTKYDIISMGLVGKNVDWNTSYKKAKSLLNPGGIIIGRNYNHSKYGSAIKQAINAIGGTIVDQAKGSFVLNV